MTLLPHPNTTPTDRWWTRSDARGWYGDRACRVLRRYLYPPCDCTHTYLIRVYPHAGPGSGHAALPSFSLLTRGLPGFNLHLDRHGATRRGTIVRGQRRAATSNMTPHRPRHTHRLRDLAYTLFATCRRNKRIDRYALCCLPTPLPPTHTCLPANTPCGAACVVTRISLKRNSSCRWVALRGGMTLMA